MADTKWKRIDEKQATAKQKYDISQSDMYQMLAYGQNYLGGVSVVYLIYPHTITLKSLYRHFDLMKTSRLRLSLMISWMMNVNYWVLNVQESYHLLSFRAKSRILLSTRLD